VPVTYETVIPNPKLKLLDLPGFKSITLPILFKVDENGKITWANLVVATGHNNNAMNRGVLQSARAYVKDGKFTPGALNRVEAVIRAFDPCLSCSTHAVGQMEMEIELRSPEGKVVDRLTRG